MVDRVNNQYYLLNAPAGSGKTTYITKRVNQLLNDDPNRNILCITYTNRAVNELKSRIKSKQIEISTIHSFINRFIEPFKTNQQVLEFFKEKYNLSTSKEIKKIVYNEKQIDKVSEGELGHDSLLEFAFELSERFPKINLKFRKYSHIFIDEYQDTDPLIIKLFYRGINNTSSQLYLLGDRMQKIYESNDDEVFYQLINKFEEIKELKDNYRSGETIVKVLNNIYNDENYKQKCKSRVKSSIKPKIILTDNIEDYEQPAKSLLNSDYLTLVLFNSDLFIKAGFYELYKVYNNIPQYQYGNKHNAISILKDDKEHYDDLLNLFVTLNDMYNWKKEKNYGELIKKIKTSKYMNKDFLLLNYEDIVKLSKSLTNLVEELSKAYTLKDWLSIWGNMEFVNQSRIKQIIQDDIYKEAVQLPIEKYINWYEFLKDQSISTQHSVKGEGHNKVIFVSKDYHRRPNVRIYELFNLWCDLDISFSNFEKFYYEYMIEIKKLESYLVKKLGNEMKCANYEKISPTVNQKLKNIYDKFQDNDYFKYFYSEHFEEDKILCSYLKNNILNTRNLRGVFGAYKLFYVGCSRAKEELVVIVDKNKIINQEKFKEKFRKIGFCFD